MKNAKNICIITSGYPTIQTPTRYTFVEELVCSMADMNNNVTVIYPNTIFRKSSKTSRDIKKLKKKTLKGNKIEIYRPMYLSASNKKIACVSTGEITNWSFIKAAESILNNLFNIEQKPDILYAHFLSPAGICAAMLGKKYGIPSFCAFGESEMWSISSLNPCRVKAQMNMLTGFISVSTENKRILLENGFAESQNIQVFPNGVNLSLFYPHDKKEMRKYFGFPQDSIIGIFIGRFDEIKQPNVVNDAANDIEGLKMIYIGSGKMVINGENILSCGNVMHDQIPMYLSSADFFILPTLAEGCCNAILEAMACGLPIISSDRTFNDDILNDTYSIRIDPTDTIQVKEAMQYLVDNSKKRMEMSIAAREASLNFDVSKRAQSIIKWINEKINEREG